MARLLHELIFEQAERAPAAVAVVHRKTSLDYAALASLVQATAHGLLALDLNRAERVAVYLPKRLETVATLFGTVLAGGAFVPINPLLKAEQVAYILRDCNVRILVTTRDRADLLEPTLADCPDLHSLVLLDGASSASRRLHHIQIIDWSDLLDADTRRPVARVIDIDMAAILYTSGSTGKPKGVVLSHRNMLTGAFSVAEYLGNRADDRILALLPFSFDYGLSQTTTAFATGASIVLIIYYHAT